MCIYIYVYRDMCVYIYIYIKVSIYIYIYIYIYTHTGFQLAKTEVLLHRLLPLRHVLPAGGRGRRRRGDIIDIM